MLDWSDLRHVLETARQGGISGAARVLGVNHATVARRITSAETALGARLFDRLASGYIPTEAGRDAVRAAEAMEQSEARLDRQIGARDVDVTGRLTITASQLMIERILAPILVAFAEEFPAVDLNILATNEVVNLAHLYLGSEFCSENNSDMKAVYELLAGQKPFVVNYNAETMNDMMATGEVTMTTHWNGFSLIGRQEANENITYAYPKEGVVGWLDSLVVPVGAQNVEAALAFMNFMMAPENIGPHTTAMGYSNAIKGAEKYVDASVATAPELNAPADVKIKFAPACGAKAQKLIDKVWTRLLQ